MIRELSFYYVKHLALIKRYNLQSIAIRKFMLNINKNRLLNDLKKSVIEFNSIYSPYLSRDLTFKNNSLVTRNNKLISPAHYFYYTNIVFDLVISRMSNEKVHNYINDNIEAYYSGILYKDINHIINPRQIMFESSYNKFQKSLAKHKDKQVFILDLQNFFDSISIKYLLKSLYERYPYTKVVRLDQFFKSLNIDTLPQFHYSIASSILSQEYLSAFDLEITSLLEKLNLQMIRFVDDMYFVNNGNSFSEKEIHNIIDNINKILWKYKLNLNPNKIRIEDSFKREVVFGYNDFDYSTEKNIEEKSLLLLNGDFINFVNKTNKLYDEDGFNIEKFTKIFQEVFSIEGENAMKVLNNFIFSGKWKKLSYSEIKHIIANHSFIFFLPDKLMTLYLMMYEHYEKINGRDEKNIRRVLKEIDKYYKTSLRYLYSSLNYLIQRNFKRKNLLNEIKNTSPELGTYIERYII